jgi:hypothetical protein
MTLPDYVWRSPVASAGSMEHLASSRLTSWKEIAQYLQKGVRTVQRCSYFEDDGKSELELLRKRAGRG